MQPGVIAQDEQAQQKQAVAQASAAVVQSGMRLGLGSGTTVALVVAEVGRRVQAGEVGDLTLVAASRRTEAAITQAGLAFTTLDQVPELDLAVDGADEIDDDFAMIKGGGGALLRERIVLAAATQRLIVVDSTKLVPLLGTHWPVPVEVVQFGWRVAERLLTGLGATPTMRMSGGAAFVTDEGNYVLDCTFGQIQNPTKLAAELSGLPGVVAHGIFVGLADRLLISGRDGVRMRNR